MLEADETIMRMCKDPAGYCLFVQILDSAAPQTLLRDNVSEISKKKKNGHFHRHLQRGGHSLSDFGWKNTDKSV